MYNAKLIAEKHWTLNRDSGKKTWLFGNEYVIYTNLFNTIQIHWHIGRYNNQNTE